MDNKHWHQELDKNNQILWLYFDRVNRSTNTINTESLEQLQQILTKISINSSLNALVIASAKKTGYIFGADIDKFESFTLEQVKEFLSLGQTVFNQIEELPFPTVAMIDGYCLGGGTELALACRYRIITEGSQIGLPEVKLGIHPGWGGTVRLPRIIGSPQALNLILSGKIIEAKSAKRMGLVDIVVPKRQLQNAALWYSLNKPPLQKLNFLNQLIEYKPFRNIFYRFIKSKLRKAVREDHYPAPYIILNNWCKGGKKSKAYEIEKNSVVKLFEYSQVTKNLLRVYQLQQKLKKFDSTDPSKEIKRVHIIGAGLMGGDIAAWCALKGFVVTFQDNRNEAIAATLKRANQLFTFKLKEKREIQKVQDRLIADFQGQYLSSAELVIEAVTEDLNLKRKIWLDINSKISPETIMATNTSSLPLHEISGVISHKERLIGIHFFNPVSRMPLVEVVYQDITPNDIYLKAMRFVKSLDKLPLPVKSNPGFLVNRILMPYLLEAFLMLGENIPKEMIDKVARDFGMPMGPIELADIVGLDVCLQVGQRLESITGDKLPKELFRYVEKGKLGKKTGEGFYKYDKKIPFFKQINPKTTVTTEQFQAIINRLFYRILKESILCLREKIVSESDLVDAGMIFGTGFPPFKGGPLHYANQIGEVAVTETFQKLQARYGDRFRRP